MLKNSVFLPDERLYRYGCNIAKGLKEERGVRVSGVIDDCAQNLAAISEVAGKLGVNFEGGRPPAAVEWLIDNHYLIEREGRQTIRAMDRRLRVRSSRQEGRDYPNVYIFCKRFLEASNGEAIPGRLLKFFEGVQDILPLAEGELSLIPAMLRFSLIGLIRDTAGLVQKALKEDREQLEELENEVAAVINSLRQMASFDAEVLGGLSIVERSLASDPAGIYPSMDEKTRESYRIRVGKLALSEGITEVEAARQAVRLAAQSRGEKAHVGWWLFVSPLGKRGGRSAGRAYITGLIMSVALITPAFAVLLGSMWFAPLILLPVYELAKTICDYIALKALPPSHIPRMALSSIPDEGRTLAAISALLTNEQKPIRLAELLEEYYIVNRQAGDNLSFAVLADLKDGKEETAESDEAILRAARAAINRLNHKYGVRFFLLLRPRTLNRRDKLWMGRERKRGAIHDLVRFISGKDSGLYSACGDQLPEAIKYIIALDEDTRLSAGTAAALTGAMLHPLNRAKIDPQKRIVTRGYGILQPRIALDLESSNRTAFSRLMGGLGGVDPYGSAMSDVYQDVFSRGIFTGKGIIDVAAYEDCLEGRIPGNTVLSHDLLEGAYLRAGLIGDIELSDRFPASVLPYFSRLHRWVRGDTQVLPWLKRRVKNEAGEREANPLPGLARLWIFDNLRRLLTPAATLLCLLLGLANPGLSVLAMVSLSAGLFISGIGVTRSGAGFGYNFSDRFNESWADILRALVLLVFLPYNAWICLSGFFIALWRMKLTRRRMLEWVPAADLKDSSTLDKTAVRMAFPVTLGILCLLPYRNIWAETLGILWLLSPVVSVLLSRPRAGKRRPGDNMKRALLDDAAEMFGFFRELMNAENNFLPPDNIQLMPDLGVAPRTSPTNIGLAMLCTAAAAELGLTTRNEAAEIIERCVSSIERMEKWRGNLLNWYDTSNLAPLEPRMVSSVDSGNFYACLLAVANALEDCEGAGTLVGRIRAICEATELDRLFDEKKKLFYISLDPVTGKPGESSYDLLASEARILSFVAIAKGMAPLKHWGRLGRLLTTDGRGVGLASWTGSMFEYLMPSIFLPDYEGSLIEESLRFAVKCQRDRMAGRYLPWGISESAYYAFDSALNYQYKAHGVQCLGLKRGLNTELVISPYSSYLALMAAPEAAFDNIKVLKKYPLSGRYGLFEGLDVTPARVGGERRAVACYMAHHVGMSLLSIASAVGDGMVQKWLMRDKDCYSHRMLLQERLPVGAVVFRNCRREVPEKRQKAAAPGYYIHNLGYDTLRPRVHLLSNGSYNLLLTDSGVSRAYCQGVKLYNFSEKIETACRGVRMALADEGGAFPIFPEDDRSDVGFRSEFYEGGAAMLWERGRLSGEVRVFVPEGEKCEVRRVRVCNEGKQTKRVRVGMYVEPVLSGEAEFEAHPMFSRLFLRAREGERTAAVTRQGRQARQLSLVLACDKPCDFTLSRNDLGRGGGGRFVDFLASRTESGQEATDALDPCLICVAELEMGPGESAAVSFSIGFGEGEKAEQTALRGLSARGGSDYMPLLARRLGLDSRKFERAMEEASRIAFGRQRAALAPEGTITGEGQPLLWRFGISGDFPIMALMPGGEDRAMLTAQFRRFALLREGGLLFDLAVVIDDAGDYSRKGMRLVVSAAAEAGAERYVSARAGIHIIDAANFSEGDIAGLRLAASTVKNGAVEREETGRAGRKYLPRASPGGPIDRAAEGVVVAEDRLPGIVHSIPLANRSFGFIACDTGCGHMWRLNSRQNKLTGWVNDPLAIEGAERLECETESGAFSLFLDDDGLPQRFSFDRGAACWERSSEGVKSRLTAFIHPYEAARVVLLELECDREVKIRWSILPQMGEKGGVLPLLAGYSEDSGAVWAKTTRGDYSPQVLALFGSVKPSGFTCSKPSGLRGEYDRAVGWGYEPALAAEYILRPENGRASLVLVAAGCDGERGIERLAPLCDIASVREMLKEAKDRVGGTVEKIRLKSGRRAVDAYVSGMALYQTVYCRIFARASYSQCGGAYGFRDQLQDCLGAVYSDPGLMKRQIIRSACRQYIEGDVQHWWHPSRGGKSVWGVRTKYSDDLLWLPFVLCDYIEKTGDEGILSQQAPYLCSPPLTDGEEERFENAARSPLREDIYGHCLRAVELAVSRGEGVHGLPLILGGDWNDGFNRVGREGRGESLWLGWFLSMVLEAFAPMCEMRGEYGRAEGYRQKAEELAEACERLFDKHYPRAFFDDGSAMGREGQGCQIDSIAQSFAIFNPHSDRSRAAKAMGQAAARLIDQKGRLIRLLDPPFEYNSRPDPGYIRCYPPGIRENGGQYTHAAVWFARAVLESERLGIKLSVSGLELMDILMPSGMGDGYMAERFVLAGDVYGGANAGRAGWSWYTGAAGWYFKTAAEGLCGLGMKDGRIISKEKPARGIGFEIAGEQV